MLGTGVRRGKWIRFEVGVEFGVSGFRREKLFTGTEVITGWVR